MPRPTVATSALPTEPAPRAVGSSPIRLALAGVLFLTVTVVPGLAAASEPGAGGGMIAVMQRLALQVAVLLAASRILGEVVERYLKQPAVLGELAAGVLLGPYALGHLLYLGHTGVLFPEPPPGSVFPVTPELNGLAQVGAILLLFRAGLETDLGQFIRFGPRALVVATGGVLLPFALGAVATVAGGFAPTATSPVALFMGAIMTATSVGITARVLSDLGRLATPEGVTIIAAAVLDDVLGILVLAVVVGVAASGNAMPADVALAGLRAIGVWLGVTVVALAAARPIARAVGWFTGRHGVVAPVLALVLAVSALVELAGLAMIIGAYVVGLAFGKTDLRRRIEEAVQPIAAFLVPIFFAVMGTLVDFEAMRGALGFGAVVAGLAMVSKLFGCGLPALGLGFNRLGATRIGIGMLPRGEVALIVAGVGLSAGIVGPELFGVAILMTVATTVLAPILLVPLFRNAASGLRR